MTEQERVRALHTSGDVVQSRWRHECPPNVDICDGGDACWDICLARGEWHEEGAE